MGQEQSNCKIPSPSSASGVTSSFSFLSKKRNSVKFSQIVVVNPNSNADNIKLVDEEIKKMKEIPRFLPIICGILPAQRISPELLKKIKTKYLFQFLNRIQQHFAICREIVSSAQTSLSTDIIKANQMINNLYKEINIIEKRLFHFKNEICKVELLKNNLNEVQLVLQDVMLALEQLIIILPIEESLSPLNNQLLHMVTQKS